MTTLFLILIIIAAVILGFIVLVQNPKGGGLAGNVAGFSNQFMGVKQTTDVLEKGTWIFAAVIAVLCLTSTFFISGTRNVAGDDIKLEAPAQRTNTTTSGSQPQVPTPAAPAQQR
ncbi:preprotein translocase subunit SecG [Flaviaesturariibacter amylovorans]|uniref:Protein-export membrane protein SecG n=1 Tax=Flaviaesturariibacter amylovorans TaxID=1084520 RepID=A0ABP8GSI8_9BACT